jgi:hypothetical protein
MMSADSLLTSHAAFLVPQHRRRHPPRIGGIVLEVDLVEARRAVDVVGCRAGKARVEHPAFFAHDGMNHVEADDVLKSLQRANDQGAVT